MATIIRDHTPRELGYRMPAEWEKHTAVWLQWPGQYPLTPDTRDLSYQMKMEKTWLLMAWEIHYHVHVCILAQNEAQNEHIRRSIEYFNFNSANISIHVTATVDVWHRDTGPVFLTDDKGGIALTDWNFNGWGSYPLWGDAEKHLPQTIADIVDKPLFIAPIFTEGGAIEVNGTGSFLGTRSSIINDNRNPGISRTEIEQALSDYLCVSNFIWLSGAPPAVCEGIFGDGTDYHIDIAARFADKNTVIMPGQTMKMMCVIPILKNTGQSLARRPMKTAIPLN